MEGPFPVVFLFNGFMVCSSGLEAAKTPFQDSIRMCSHCQFLALQLRSSFYKAYAQRLASWGYAIVQYDTGILPILTTAAEVCASSVCTVLVKRLHMPGRPVLLMGLTELTIGLRFLQLTFLPQIMTWAQQQEQLGLKLDLGRTAVVGHSRGGQLAALHLGEGKVAEATARMHAQVARHAP